MWSEAKMATRGQRSYDVCETSSYESDSSDDEGSVYENSARNNVTDPQGYQGEFEEAHKQRRSILQDNTKYNQDRSQPTKSKRNLNFEASIRKSLGRGQRCHSRNAIMARMNRLKKKQYVENLENDISKVTQENGELKGTVTSQTKTISALKNRIHYLESVLANSSELGMLLKTVKKATGLPTINSLEKNAATVPLKNNITTESTDGFPPPQPDHIYSKTPEVSCLLATGSISPLGEDNLINAADSFLLDDQLGPLLADDVSMPLSPIEDVSEDLDLSPGSPHLGNSFLLDYPAFNEPFDFEKFDGDQLTPGVGICLHIAKKRVSLEFCQHCNNNSVAAWDDNIFADG